MTTTFDQKEKLQLLFQTYDQILNDIDNENNIDFLVKIAAIFRPKSIKENCEVNITALLLLLNENESYRKLFSEFLRQIVKNKDFDQIISDAAIINDTDFLHEVKKRTFEKILPQQPPKNTLQFILNQVFYSSSDPIWIQQIPKEQILELFELLELPNLYQYPQNQFALSDTLYALEVLMHRVTGRAMETNVNKMVPEFQNFESPFIAIQREFAELSLQMQTSHENISSDNLLYRQVLLLHKQCEKYISTAFENSHKFGISLKVNQALLRIRQQLERIKEVLPFLVLNKEDERQPKTIAFAMLLIKYNCYKNDIKKLINESTHVISYEITQHTAHTGEKYITNSNKEYIKMLLSASGGGALVAFLCITKILLSGVHASDFGHAFYYSLNYAIGFITIYLLGFTLATKQPSMTAATLAKALEDGKKNIAVNQLDKYRDFAMLFSRVFRSQFIAFVGNVFLVFPTALLLIWLIDLIFNNNLAASKWEHLLHDLNPVTSLAIFHAAIAGVFLFLSGLIAGSVANRDKHNAIYYRIQENPFLKKFLGKKKTKNLSKWYEKKWAGIMSNMWFGVFMGSVGSIGIFLGLSLDVRHITFAAGNLALGMYGNYFNIPASMIIWGIFGIGIIGFVNFIVSFSLSLFLAFRSRGISLLELRLVIASIWRYFKEKPMHFFFPPKQHKKQEVTEETTQESSLEN